MILNKWIKNDLLENRKLKRIPDVMEEKSPQQKILPMKFRISGKKDDFKRPILNPDRKYIEKARIDQMIEIRHQIDELKVTIQKIDKDKQNQESKNTSLLNEIVDLRSRISKLQAEAEQMTTERAAELEARHRAEIEAAKIDRRRKRGREVIENAERELNAEAEEATRELEAAKSELAALKRKGKAEIKKLQEKKQILAGENQQLRAKRSDFEHGRS